MTGPVSITYNVDHNGRPEAYLNWTLPSGETEMLVGRGDTFEQAKRQAIATFRRIPPSEWMKIEEE